MSKLHWGAVGLLGLAMLAAAGCQTFPDARGLHVSQVVPKENEQIVRDQLLILVDSTDSVGINKAFCYEKALTEAFAAAMPEGKYEAGLYSFSGTPEDQWLKYPSSPFCRDGMVKAAADLKLLGGSTPLAHALQSLKAPLQAKTGRSALLVISDGKVCCPPKVLQACEALKAAHSGDLCIYTVHVGNCPCGRKLMEKMATVNGCGGFYEAAGLNSPAAIEGLVRDIFLGPKEVAKAPAPGPKAERTKIILSNVLFDLDKAILKPEGKVEVDKLVAEMKAHPKDTVLIEGHTCDLASDEYNLALGQRRADAVKAYMLQAGIDAARLSTKSYGESKPASPNDCEEHRKLNRRAEFNITLGQD